LTGPIGVAVVGAGYWGPNLVRTFLGLPVCQVRYVCDQRPGRLEAMREKFPHITLTDDYSEVLQDPGVEAVAIATPVSTHRELGDRAIAAGKHVLIEKPLASTVADARALTEAAKSANRVLAVGHIFVYHPAVASLRQLVREGLLGELCYVASSRVNLGPPASEVDVIWDLAVHDLSILQSLIPGNPVDVVAEGRQFVHPTLVDVAFITLRYGNGFVAHLHASWLSPVKVRTLFLAGTLGSATFDDAIQDGKLVISDRGEDSRINLKASDTHDLFYRPGELVRPQLEDVAPLTAECRRFLECIVSGGRPEADGEAGVAVVEMLEAAGQSIREHRPVRLASVEIARA